MSLNFGIYLVEQRIISPEQFCGLVKIQQESGATLASVAIRQNLLTIKQVATVLDQHEMNPNKSFAQIAIELDFLDSVDAERLISQQQLTTPTIRKLVQECGLLTERQCTVLFQHYLQIGTRPIGGSSTDSTQTTPVPTAPPTNPTGPITPTTPIPERRVEEQTGSSTVRHPKYKQRPVIVSPYTSPAT